MQNTSNRKNIVVIGGVFALIALGFIGKSYLSPRDNSNAPTQTASSSKADKESQKQALELLTTGDKLLAEDKQTRAIESYRKGLSKGPDPVFIRSYEFTLAVALYRNGQREEGLNAFNELAKGNDFHAQMARNMVKKIQSNPNWGKKKL